MIDVPADLCGIRRLAEWLHTQVDAGKVGPAAAVDLELALVEAGNNIVEHGHCGSAGQIRFEFTVCGDVAVATLSDRGSPVPTDLYKNCRDVPLDATGGRGASIVHSCVDKINYTSLDGINRLILTKFL